MHSKFVMNRCETTDSRLIISGLNEFFANVGKKSAANFNSSVNANDMLNFPDDSSPFTFCFEPANDDVKQIVVVSLDMMKGLQLYIKVFFFVLCGM